jgi:hypothetical protein
MAAEVSNHNTADGVGHFPFWSSAATNMHMQDSRSWRPDRTVQVKTPSSFLDGGGGPPCRENNLDQRKFAGAVQVVK